MSGPAPIFRLLVVPGVTVDKWSRVWSERLPEVPLELVPADAAQAAALLAADVDAGLVRLPVDRERFDAISLYAEVTVAVVARDHLLTAADELDLADLADETLLRPFDDVLDWSGMPIPAPPADRPATTADAVELVAADAGILVVPLSLARLHHRRDVTHRVVADAPTSSIALAWMRDRYGELVEEMIGIVRGRTANSSRGRGATPAASTALTAPASAGGRSVRPAAQSDRAGKRTSNPNPRKPRRRGR